VAPIETVHVVAKTHLDLGFTALAAEVEARYLEELFPRAIEVAEALRARGGDERLVWTTGSWILWRALADPDRERALAVERAVEEGLLSWHALPLTFHTELMDAPLVRSALSISAELDERFGRRTTAAKMTDVPGHTRGLVPLLAEAGVTFLHLGVNPAWPVPDVPPTFRWRSRDGSEVVVAYQAGGYGGEVIVEGCPHALAFLHSGDNLGPPSADEVLAAHGELAARFPGATVRASALDAFARALEASGASAHLPVVTAEIGDPWLFGAGSDPQKVAALRAALRGPRSAEGDRRLLLVAEHTWGLDQKEILPVEPAWDDVALEELRRSAPGIRFERSWAEQRAYLRDGDPSTRSPAPLVGLGPAGEPEGWTRAELGPPLPIGTTWLGEVDPAHGALVGLGHVLSGRQLAGAGHRLGGLAHQTFSADDYERFYGQLSPQPADEWWARRDNTKPGIEAADARSAWADAVVADAWTRTAPGGGEVLVRVRLPADHPGAPPTAWLRWRAPGPDLVALDLWWPAKPATRLPEATWCTFSPRVEGVDRWTIDKLGERVSPLDVVRRGGRSLHAVGRDLRHHHPDGDLLLRTLDAPLVSPGAPNLLDADPPLPDLAGGWHVLLHDNAWGTNFPMWSEGAASFSFELELG
jgi:hypothetical protein